MQRPTIFLSSTVYDFRDLRSALKDYLELRGCTVFASDYNDFAKDLEPHSYEACLRTIEKADLFVLFIGSRVGGLVDAANGISITRAEYRRAYQLAQEGRIRIMSFVRDEVWTHRESLKEMARFLKNEEGKDREIDIKGVPTKFMTNAEITIGFIEEVSRNAETGAAAKGRGQFPIANWLHRFSTFPEVRAALDPLILSGLNVSQAAGRKSLQVLLVEMLRGMLVKMSKSPMIPSVSVRNLVAKIGLTTDAIMEPVALDVETWSRLVTLLTFAGNKSVDAAPLVPILTDPLLLSYDAEHGSFEPTPEHWALGALIEQIAAFNQAKAGFDFAAFLRGQNVKRPIAVRCADLASALHLLIRWAAMAETAVALTRAMGGQDFQLPAPMPRGPFVDQEQALQDESLTAEEVQAYLDTA